MTALERAQSQEAIDWGNKNNRCNVIVIKGGVVYSNIFINGDTVTERSETAEKLLIEIATNDNGCELVEEDKEYILDQGYYEFISGDGSACISWSAPGGEYSYPDPEFRIENVR